MMLGSVCGQRPHFYDGWLDKFRSARQSVEYLARGEWMKPTSKLKVGGVTIIEPWTSINIRLWLSGHMLFSIEVLAGKYLNNIVEKSEEKNASMSRF